MWKMSVNLLLRIEMSSCQKSHNTGTGTGTVSRAIQWGIYRMQRRKMQRMDFLESQECTIPHQLRGEL